LVKNYHHFEGAKVGWLSKDVVTFGPVDMGHLPQKATREPRDYKKWDIFLSFGGYDPSNLHLCFSKRDHSGLYGAPDEPLYGVVGRIIQGGHIISMLRKTDALLTFNPLTQLRKRVLQLRPDELEKEMITHRMEIFTYLPVTLYEEAGQSVDHFLAALNSSSFQIDEASSMYLKNIKFRGAKIQPTNSVFRQNGTITIRNHGNDIGSIYLYKSDTSFSSSHNVVGRVDPKVLPLIENANPGVKLLVNPSPPSLKFIGKTQKFALNSLESYDISHIRVGDESDDAIIVEQRPTTTMDVWTEKTCVTLGLTPDQIVKFKLFHEDTPLSIKHFRKYANMLYDPIGKLQVLENLKSLMLFLPVEGESIEAVPKESEVEYAPKGAIGITNALRRLTGSMGIRLAESDNYGPTGETFEGTNIIGKVVSGLEFLENLETGDVVWFMEVTENE
jgi:putative methanogenesis marker protein 3